MHFELLFPSKYLKAADLLGKEQIVKIKSVSKDTIFSANGKSEECPVLAVEGTPKLWVLNRTNAKRISKMHGTEVTNWVGKEVTVRPETTRFGPEQVECIRVVPKCKR